MSINFKRVLLEGGIQMTEENGGIFGKKSLVSSGHTGCRRFGESQIPGVLLTGLEGRDKGCRDNSLLSHHWKYYTLPL